MKSPLVSIITATYNQKRYVAECVESVLAQTYGDWEQIVVDDGSVDGTPDVVESYGDPRVRCIRLPHRGLAALAESYNAGLAASRGELVAVLEGDDLWPADKLEAQVPVFRDPRVFLSWGRAAVVDAEGRKVGERASVRGRNGGRTFDGRELFARLTRVNVVSPAVTVMVRRGALEAISGFRQTGSSLYVDLPTWLWLAATSQGHARYLDHVVGCYRTHQQQTTRKHKALMDLQHLEVVRGLESQMDAATLAGAGWDGTVRRRARVGGLIAEGVAYLGERRFRSARSSFRQALSEADTARDRLKAGLGMLSTVVRTDLLTAAYALRESA